MKAYTGTLRTGPKGLSDPRSTGGGPTPKPRPIPQK